MWIAPAALAHAGITHEDVRGGVIFAVGLVGTHIFAAVTTYAPALIRKVIGARLGLDPEKPQATGETKATGGNP